MKSNKTKEKKNKNVQSKVETTKRGGNEEGKGGAHARRYEM